MTFRMRLAWSPYGWTGDDEPVVAAVDAVDEQRLTPETVTAGTPAWQRAKAMAAKKRQQRGAH